ncbi:MAG: FAD-dependent monooxygenase [Sphingosinicella sp.]|nr:FAD-dependent monooxygenase [Sphingosinicella sp.]
MESHAARIETSVLIIGAGPAGAAAAALLATYGIENVMINKYGGVANSPRAHITNQRAVEVFRDLGLERDLIAVATPQSLMGEHVYATSLTGRELGRLRTWYTHPHFKAEHDLASPCSVCDVPQDLLEPILVNAAALRGTAVRFNTELLSFEQDDNGVSARVIDRLTGMESTIRCQYMIGADGANSLVARLLDLPFEGHMNLGGSINVVFKADLERFCAHRPGDMYWFLKPGVGMGGNGVGVLRMARPWTRWVGVWGYDINGAKPDLSHEFGVRIAHALIGDDSISVEIESMSTWTVNDVFALDNMKGRVFCVGDAVHRHPPMNGLGSNTSIQDSYNLAWKLALVLRGVASPSLLETYRDERVPVGRQIVRRANESMHTLPAIFQALNLSSAPDEETLESAINSLSEPGEVAKRKRHAFEDALQASIIGFNTLGVETNQNYHSAAVIDDGEPEPAYSRDEELYYNPSTKPGRHLPHLWLIKDQRRVSIFDLCGKGRFTVLTGVGGEIWHDAARAVFERLGVQIVVRTIGRGCNYEDSYGDYRRLSGVDDDGALLIRPDHVVAWRSQKGPDSSPEELLNVFEEILGKSTCTSGPS